MLPGVPTVNEAQLEQLRASLLSRQSSGEDAAALWTAAVAFFRKTRLPFESRRALWQELFAAWNVRERGPAPIWFPDERTTSSANVTALMRRIGCRDVAALHRWSVNEPQEFWTTVIKLLEIRFRHPPAKTLEVDRGVAHPDWLVGARLNIVESCFAAAAESTAIVSTDVEGQLHRQSYGELQLLVQRVAAGLRAAGFVPGDRIAVLMPMTPISVAVYLGIIYAGCVAVSIADSFASPEIQRRMQIADAKGVICADRFSRAGKTIDLYERVLQAEPPPAIVIGEGDAQRAGCGRKTNRGMLFCRMIRSAIRSSLTRVTSSTSYFRPARPAIQRQLPGSTPHPSSVPRTASCTTICTARTWLSGPPI